MEEFKKHISEVPSYYLSRDFLNIAKIVPISRASGPGIRFVIWLQGCCKKCKGCISNDKINKIKKNLIFNIYNLIEFILLIKNLDGITFYGGEPLLQFRALSIFCDILKKNNLSIIIYTGYNFEELKKFDNIYMKKLLNNCDILIDGEFMENLKINEPMRGSKNQRIIFLSSLYKNSNIEKNKRKIHFVRMKDSIQYIGIPPKELPRMSSFFFNSFYEK